MLGPEFKAIENFEDLSFHDFRGLASARDDQSVLVSDDESGGVRVGAVLECDHLGVSLLRRDLHDAAQRAPTLDPRHASSVRNLTQDVQVR